MVNSLQNRWYTAQPRLPKSGAWMSHIHNGIIDIPAEDSPASDAERFWKCDFAIQDDPIEISEIMGILTVERHTTVRRGGTNNPTESLRQRLANANDYFHRKASEVLNDEAALRLLAAMYKDVVMDISEFDPCENGIPLAKLTAANFCEIGKNVIYITEGGQRFIDSIEGT